MVDLVEFESCEPVGCSAIEVKWSYNPVCPEVAYIEIELLHAGLKQNVSVGTTNYTVTDLTVDDEYHVCINAMDKDGKEVHSSCRDEHCRTAYEGKYSYTFDVTCSFLSLGVSTEANNKTVILLPLT